MKVLRGPVRLGKESTEAGLVSRSWDGRLAASSCRSSPSAFVVINAVDGTLSPLSSSFCSLFLCSIWRLVGILLPLWKKA